MPSIIFIKALLIITFITIIKCTLAVEKAHFWLNKERSIKEPSPAKVGIYKVPFFDRKQACRKVTTENGNIWNFPPTRFVHTSMKSLIKPSRFFRMWRYWGVKEAGISKERGFSLSDNQWKIFCQGKENKLTVDNYRKLWYLLSRNIWPVLLQINFRAETGAWPVCQPRFWDFFVLFY